MSKEERIQEQVAEKLGFRWTCGLMAPNTIDSPDGETAIQEADDFHKKLWVALIAAETKLEPRTVAETIDYRAHIEELDKRVMLFDMQEVLRPAHPLPRTRYEWAGRHRATVSYMSGERQRPAESIRRTLPRRSSEARTRGKRISPYLL